jgi:hypothetical protein
MPILIGIPLALVSSVIFAASVALAMTTSGQGPILSGMLTTSSSLIASVLFSGFVRALPVTIVLLPLAYYLSRRRMPVTPPFYAFLGLAFGLLMLLPSLLPLLWSAEDQATVAALNAPMRNAVITLGIGSLIAALVSGALFGYLMQGHYARYRLRQEEPR